MSVQSWCDCSSSAVISQTKFPWKRASVPSVNWPLRCWEKELTMCGNESGNGAAVSYINMPVSLSTTRTTETASPSPTQPFPGSTWLVLVIYLNCCHLHFNYLAHTSTVSASPYSEGSSRLSWSTSMLRHPHFRFLLIFTGKIMILFKGTDWCKQIFTPWKGNSTDFMWSNLVNK